MFIEIDGIAKPQGSKNAYQRGGRIVLVEASKLLKPWRLTVAQQVADAAIVNNFKKLGYNEPATIAITFLLPRPKSITERKRFWPTVKPDLDKLTRAILDALTMSNAVWVDDSQVVSLKATKRYTSAQPKTLIVIGRPND